METETIQMDKPIYDKLAALAKQKQWRSPYAYLVEIILEKSREYERRGCVHCPNNPAAQEPFLKMKKLPMDPDFRKHLETEAKRQNRNIDCFACECVTDFLRPLEAT